jgi:hypothetical protein
VQPPYLDFAGKVITVFINSGALVFSEQPGWTLDNPRFEEQLGRIFLVGKSVGQQHANPPWHHGAVVNIPWEAVSYYLVFDSVEAYREATGRYRPEGPKPGWFGRRSRP